MVEYEKEMKTFCDAWLSRAYAPQTTKYLHCRFFHYLEIHKRARELGLAPSLLKNEGWEAMNKVDRAFFSHHSTLGAMVGRKRTLKANGNHK